MAEAKAQKKSVWLRGVAPEFSFPTLMERKIRAAGILKERFSYLISGLGVDLAGLKFLT